MDLSARPKMVHCYCMLPIFREAKEDFGKIVEILKKQFALMLSLFNYTDYYLIFLYSM